jgi:integrase
MIDRKITSLSERTEFDDAAGLPSVSMDDLTLSELADMYSEWARDYHQDAAIPGYAQNWLTSLVIEIIGDVHWTEFTAELFKLIPTELIKRGKNRRVINQIMTDTCTWMQWCYDENKISRRVDLNLRAVRRLRKNKRGVLEKVPKVAVLWQEAEKLFPFLAPSLRTMVTAQFWAGMRPGEVCIMRPRDLLLVPSDTAKKNGADDLMYYFPCHHKNLHRDDNAKLIKLLTWRVRESLQQFIDRSEHEDEYLFKPVDAHCWAIDYNVKEKADRRNEPAYEPPSATKRRERLAATRRQRLEAEQHERFDSQSYARRISLAFDRAARSGVELERWSPNQLRHGAMTMMGDFGYASAGSLLLGHKHLQTSLTHYDHATLRRLARVADKLAEIDPPTSA